MQILLDADAAPKVIKEILFRAAERRQVRLTLVANTTIQIPKSEFIFMTVVKNGPDEADHEIARIAEKDDLVITGDLPLADRVITKGAYVISFHGDIFNADNIKQHLTMRELMQNLRNIDIQTGGPAPYSQKNRQRFANQLDIYLTKVYKSG